MHSNIYPSEDQSKIMKVVLSQNLRQHLCKEKYDSKSTPSSQSAATSIEVRMGIRGVKKDQKDQQFQSELALQLFPFSMLYTFQKHKACVWEIMGSAPPRAIHFGKKIQRILKMHKGKKLPTHLSIYLFWNIFLLKLDPQVPLLWSRCFFRHQDQPYRPMS